MYIPVPGSHTLQLDPFTVDPMPAGQATQKPPVEELLQQKKCSPGCGTAALLWSSNPAVEQQPCCGAAARLSHNCFPRPCIGAASRTPVVDAIYVGAWRACCGPGNRGLGSAIKACPGVTCTTPSLARHCLVGSFTTRMAKATSDNALAATPGREEDLSSQPSECGRTAVRVFAQSASSST